MTEFMSQTKKAMRNKYITEQRRTNIQSMNREFQTVKMLSNQLIEYLVIYKNNKHDHFIYKSVKALLEKLIFKYETQNEILESQTDVNLFKILADYLSLPNLIEDLKVKTLDLINLLIILNEKIAQSVSIEFLNNLTIYLDKEVFVENVLMLFGNLLLNNQDLIQLDDLICIFIKKINDLFYVKKNIETLKNMFWFMRILTVYYGEICFSHKQPCDVSLNGLRINSNIDKTNYKCYDNRYNQNCYMEIEEFSNTESIGKNPDIKVFHQITVVRAVYNFELLSVNLPKAFDHILRYFINSNNEYISYNANTETALIDFLWLVNFMFHYFDITNQTFICKLQIQLYHLLNHLDNKKIFVLLYLQSLNLNIIFAKSYIATNGLEEIVSFLIGAILIKCDEIAVEVYLFIENMVVYLSRPNNIVSHPQVAYLVNELECNRLMFNDSSQAKLNRLIRVLGNMGLDFELRKENNKYFE